MSFRRVTSLLSFLALVISPRSDSSVLVPFTSFNHIGTLYNNVRLACKQSPLPSPSSRRTFPIVIPIYRTALRNHGSILIDLRVPVVARRQARVLLNTEGVQAHSGNRIRRTINCKAFFLVLVRNRPDSHNPIESPSDAL